jgi:hypothetical protein
MNENKGLLSSSLGMVGRNKRYIFWFWLLNLTLAEFGAAAFRKSAHAVMDHSLYADRLVHGFDLAVYLELVFRPEFGATAAKTTPAMFFAFLFFAATVLFLPGVFMGYASRYRLPREEFFRACGRNLWRFIRLLIVAGIVMVVIAGALFAGNAAMVKKAGESTNEVLPFELQMTGLFIIFLIMTTLRIWFDLAEADIVLDDQRAVRRSIATGFRHAFRGLFQLLASYVFVTIVAAIVLIGGLMAWMKLVAPENVIGAFLVTQFILFLLLIPRFWQRGIAVSYWRQKMLQPVVAPQPITPQPIVPVPTPPTAPTIPTPPAADPV